MNHLTRIDPQTPITHLLEQLANPIIDTKTGEAFYYLSYYFHKKEDGILLMYNIENIPEGLKETILKHRNP